MIINKDKSIKEVKEIFSFIFPELNIEFYKRWFNPFEPSPPKLDCDENVRISDINPDLEDSGVQFEYTSTVEQIVKQFESKFGLYVQIFRRPRLIRFHPSIKNNLTLETFNNLN